MSLRTRSAQQCVCELLRLDRKQRGFESFVEHGCATLRALFVDSDNQREAWKVIHKRLGPFRASHDNYPRSCLLPAPHGTGEFATDKSRSSCEVLQNSPAGAQRMMNVNPLLPILRASFSHGNRFEDFLFGFRAKAPDVPHLAGFASSF